MTPFTTPPQERANHHLNGLFSHSKAEALLQRLCASIERHEIEITSLRCEVDSSQAHITRDIDNINNTLSDIKEKMNNLENRVQVIEKSIRLPGSPINSTVTLGEAVISNRRTIANTLNLVSQKADEDTIKESFENQSNTLKELMGEYTKDLASNDTVEKINDAMSSLMARVDVIGDDMCNKVDKCYIKTLSADATCIKNYANFVRTIQTSTKTMETGLKEIESKTHEHSSKIHSFETKIQSIVDDIKDRPTIDKVKQIDSLIQPLMERMENIPDTFEMNKIQEHNHKILSDKLNPMEDDIKTLFSAHETLARHLTKRIDGIYDKSKIKSAFSDFVRNEDFEGNMVNMSRLVEAKACKESLLQLQQVVQQLESELCITKRKADLAAKFVGLCGNK